MSTLTLRKWTDADRIKEAKRLTAIYARKNEKIEERRKKAARSLDRERQKNERYRQKTEIEIQKLNRQTKLAEAKARERRALAAKKKAEADVWKQRYGKIRSVVSPFIPKSKRRVSSKTAKKLKKRLKRLRDAY